MYGVDPLTPEDMPQAAVDPLMTSFKTARSVPAGGLLVTVFAAPAVAPISKLGPVPVAYDEITEEFSLSSPINFPFAVPVVTFPVAYEF